MAEQKTVGQFLYDYLKNEGVTEIFGVPGEGDLAGNAETKLNFNISY
jgi:TPP-dependent 2-oxoacid decarboxylase